MALKEAMAFEKGLRVAKKAFSRSEIEAKKADVDRNVDNVETLLR